MAASLTELAPSSRGAPAQEHLRPLARLSRIVTRTLKAFFDDNVTRLGAALAFYTTIAVAPLMVLAIAAAGIIFDETTARERVLAEITNLAGSPASSAIQSVHNPATTNSGVIATVLSTVTLIFGAFGVFRHLQDALNSIWRVETPPGQGWKWFLMRRLFSFATVLITGFLLVVSLIASAVITWLETRMVGLVDLPVGLIQIGNLIFSLGVVTLLFALIFRLLPDRPIPWRHVWFGAAVTAFLFTAGKTILGFYLSRATLTSAYGAAGSLIVLLLWSYYAAQIVFLGAEFTRVATLSRGGRDFSPLDAPAEQKRTP